MLKYLKKFLNKVNGGSKTAKKIADDRIPSAKQTSSKKLLGKNNDTKKSALERLLEKFRWILWHHFKDSQDMLENFRV